MFFHKDLFINAGIDPDVAHFIAKLCNQEIDERASIYFGNLYTNGQGELFSTEKKETDTHVLVALEVSSMGSMKPSEAPIIIDKPTKEDRERMLAVRNKQLEKEIEQMRGKK